MGTVYTDKSLLLEKIAERVGPNTEFKTSSQDIQDNSSDIVESLWSRSDCCDPTYILLDTAPGYNLQTKANYTVQPISGGNIDLYLPTPTDEHLGYWEFYIHASVNAATAVVSGAGYVSPSLNEEDSLIVKCIKFYTTPTTFQYKYIQIVKTT